MMIKALGCAAIFMATSLHASDLKFIIEGNVVGVSNGLTEEVSQGDVVQISAILDSAGGQDTNGFTNLVDSTLFDGDSVSNTEITIGDFYQANEFAAAIEFEDVRLNEDSQFINLSSFVLPASGGIVNGSVRVELEFQLSTPFKGAGIEDDVIGKSEIITIPNHYFSTVQNGTSTKIYLTPNGGVGEFIEFNVINLYVQELGPVEPIVEFLDIAHVGDINFDGVPDIATLRLEESNKIIVHVNDAVTGERLSRLAYYSPNFMNPKMTIVADMNGNGAPEVAVLAEVIGEDKYRLTIKDSLSDEEIVKRNIVAR